MHLKRLLLAVIVLPLLYLYVTGLSTIYFLFLLTIASIIAQYEFYSMFNVTAFLRYSGIVFGILTLSFICLLRFGLTELLVFSFLAIACIRLFSIRNPESSLYNVATVFTGIIYIPGLLGYQIYLREQGSGWIIFLYGCVWASDSLAYYIGKAIGKRKLYEQISPNKTVAGAVGSVIGGGAGGAIIRLISADRIPLSFPKAVMLGLIIGIVAIIGDLVESMFKRDAGVKDSSNILPGHGGILDKLDGVIFAGPVLYWCSIGLRLIS